jgi:hypothetical protein
MNNSHQRPNNGQAEPIIRADEENDKEQSDPFLVLNNDHRIFMNLLRLPASLNEAQTAALLGFKRDQIPILVARGFLKPLRNPAPNAEKLFARVRVLANAEDEQWLSRAKAALNQYWRLKNARKTKAAASFQPKNDGSRAGTDSANAA